MSNSFNGAMPFSKAGASSFKLFRSRCRLDCAANAFNCPNSLGVNALTLLLAAFALRFCRMHAPRVAKENFAKVLRVNVVPRRVSARPVHLPADTSAR